MAAAQTYQSEFTGLQMDERFRAVATLVEALTVLEQAIAAKYTKPADGIPPTDMDASVQSALALALTSVQSLADYYTKIEVDQLLAAINGMDYVDVATLPTASASTLGKIYLVGPDASGYYSYYYTSYDGSAYSWVGPLGTTQISLANYATKAELSQLDQEINGGETIQTIPKAKSASDTRIARNGSITTTSATGFSVNSYPVTAGKSYNITVPAMSNAYSAVYAFANKDTITTATAITLPVPSVEGPVTNYSASVIIPEGFTYLFICYGTSAGEPTVTGPVALTGMVDQIAALESATAELRGDVDEISLRDCTFGLTRVKIEGYYLNSNSNLTARASSNVLTFKDIPSGAKMLRLTGNAIGGATRTISFYSADEVSATYIIYGRTYSGAIDRFMEIPAGTKMFAISQFSDSETIAVTDLVYDIPSYDCIDKPVTFSGTALFFGDSITAGAYSTPNGLVTDATKSFAKLLCDRLGLTISNKGVGGSLFTKDDNWQVETIEETVKATTDTADVIFIAGGTNDYWRSVEIGDMDSVSEYELCGALNSLCAYLQTQYEGVPVFFITPINSIRRWKTSKNAGAGTYPMELYRDAIFRMAVKYGYHVIDGSKVGFPTEESDYSELIIYDGTHPTELGHMMYAKTLAGKLL